MKFATTTNTVLSRKSSIVFNFNHTVTAQKIAYRADMLVEIECEQGFGAEPKYTGRIAIFANQPSADRWLHYTMPSKAVEDLSVALAFQQSPAAIGYLILANSPSFVHRDSGNAIGDREDMLERAVWDAFAAEVDGLPFNKSMPFAGRPA